jgi:hypothetical protein
MAHWLFGLRFSYETHIWNPLGSPMTRTIAWTAICTEVVSLGIYGHNRFRSSGSDGSEEGYTRQIAVC